MSTTSPTFIEDLKLSLKIQTAPDGSKKFTYADESTISIDQRKLTVEAKTASGNVVGVAKIDPHDSRVDIVQLSITGEKEIATKFLEFMQQNYGGKIWGIVDEKNAAALKNNLPNQNWHIFESHTVRGEQKNEKLQNRLMLIRTDAPKNEISKVEQKPYPFKELSLVDPGVSAQLQKMAEESGFTPQKIEFYKNNPYKILAAQPGSKVFGFISSEDGKNILASCRIITCNNVTWICDTFTNRIIPVEDKLNLMLQLYYKVFQHQPGMYALVALPNSEKQPDLNAQFIKKLTDGSHARPIDKMGVIKCFGPPGPLLKQSLTGLSTYSSTQSQKSKDQVSEEEGEMHRTPKQ